MLKKVMTASLVGVDADFVLVETDLQMGLPGINVVGLADTTIKEAKERIRSAIVNSGYQFPKRKLTVNLSPAGKPKEGSHFDLPIAVGILGTENSRLDTEGFGIIGELSLDGSVCGVRGALPLAIGLRETGVKKLIIPASNAAETAMLKDVEIYPVENLLECIGLLEGSLKIDRYIIEEKGQENTEDYLDFIDVIGQETAKRALMTAAAGMHGILMIGSPGSGKTMMAKRLPYIMPELTYEEQLEITKIRSAAGLPLPAARPRRPFRAPHHTITKAALIGGGRIPHPGELSLAHNGILFLDELGEFEPATIELLRQPLEEGHITIGRARAAARLPSRVMLVAAANPCKCGYRGDDRHICTCTGAQLQRYFSKFSGPMLDRIDMHIRIVSVTLIGDATAGQTPVHDSMSTAQMKACVQRAAEIQKARYIGTDITANGDLTETQVKEYCRMSPEAEQFLNRAFARLGFSMRTYYKMLRVARTIADLDTAAPAVAAGAGDRLAYVSDAPELIELKHIAEALRYRELDDFYRRADDGR